MCLWCCCSSTHDQLKQSASVAAVLLVSAGLPLQTHNPGIKCCLYLRAWHLDAEELALLKVGSHRITHLGNRDQAVVA
jgi:hypothetical protein